jgi:hypothetical protein
LLDVYIAPMSFVTQYGVKLEKGAYAEITGTQTQDTVLAYHVSTGVRDKVSGMFHENLTIFLRDDSGPFWTE